MKRRGWFAIPGVQDGDRNISDQLKGLGRALASAQGRIVWDFGAAEGLIAREFAKAGAEHVLGLEVVKDSVKASQQVLRHHDDAMVVQADLNNTEGARALLNRYLSGGCDIALFLAILHKLQDPHALVQMVLEEGEPQLVVMRMPERTPGFVQDHRSRMRVFDIHGQMLAAHYGLVHVDRGHFNEWVGYYEKGQPCTVKP
jgi:NAD(P)-dependent dehydrogenase (short-subunit alcohol dehydrogenase family)